MYERERKRRRDAGVLQLTERDQDTLKWITEQYCISFDQARKLLGRAAKVQTKEAGVLSISATYHALDRWLQLELIEQPKKIISNYPCFIWLSRRGIAQLGLAIPYYQPRLSTIKHLYVVNNLRLHFEKQGLIWYSKRMLARDTEERPQPDAEIRIGQQQTIAVCVIESPFQYDITLQEHIDTLKHLGQKRKGDQETRRYERLWYFLHAEALPIFEQAVSLLDNDIRRRVRLFGLDTQAHTQIAEDIRAPIV